MNAIILAGGAGTRLKSVVKDIPKPMADIGGRPFLAYLMDALARQGIQHVLLSVGYLHEVIERHFGTRYNGMDLAYNVEQEPLGTGGAVRKALRSSTDDDILVMNGDTYFDVDLKAFLAFHRMQKADITLAVTSQADTGRYGAVVIDDTNRITGFREKHDRGQGYINGGVYLMGRSMRSGSDPIGKASSFERDFLASRTAELNIRAFVSNGYFVDIGIPEDYERARRELGPFVAGKRT